DVAWPLIDPAPPSPYRIVGSPALLGGDVGIAQAPRLQVQDARAPATQGLADQKLADQKLPNQKLASQGLGTQSLSAQDLGPQDLGPQDLDPQSSLAQGPGPEAARFEGAPVPIVVFSPPP